jgi:hypothetical protein
MNTKALRLSATKGDTVFIEGRPNELVGIDVPHTGVAKSARMLSSINRDAGW